MQKGWIYEVIVSTYRDGKPHSAPIGVWTDDFVALGMEIYKGSGTLGAIMDLGEFAVNLVVDVNAFYDSLFDAARVEYRDSPNINAPIIKNVSAVIEARLEEAEDKGDRFRLKSLPINVEASGPVKLINRAEAIAIESLILATRLQHFPGSKVREALRENYRVAGKVAPGSQYEEILRKLVETVDAATLG
jgi:hypothetical protein